MQYPDQQKVAKKWLEQFIDQTKQAKHCKVGIGLSIDDNTKTP